jgi:hypothetical protein
VLCREAARIRWCAVKPHQYDIVRKDDDKYAVWLESASDLNTAESRIRELTSVWPGEFLVIDQQTHRIVAIAVSNAEIHSHS